MNKINPSHYRRWDYECWEAMEKLFGKEELKSFCKLNSFKYSFRAGNKDGEEALSDIKKAKWYDNKYEELSDKNWSK